MAAEASFVKRLLITIKPTSTQTLSAVFLSLGLITLAQSHTLLSHIGITPEILDASGQQFALLFDGILRSPIASQAALVTFWAVIGLVAYLVCWGAYNAIIEARNEVTLSTSYTNRGHWRGPFETLALKSVAGVGLTLILISLWPAVSIWLALSANAITDFSVTSALLALVAVLGFAVQLYATLAAIQLTFTPWYRAEAFTEV